MNCLVSREHDQDLSLTLALLSSTHENKDLRCRFQNKTFIVNEYQIPHFDFDKLNKLYQNECAWGELFQNVHCDESRKHFQQVHSQTPGFFDVWLKSHLTQSRPPSCPFLYEIKDQKVILKMCLSNALFLSDDKSQKVHDTYIQWDIFEPLKHMNQTHDWYRQAMLSAQALHTGIILYFEKLICNVNTLVSNKMDILLEILMYQTSICFFDKYKTYIKIEQKQKLERFKEIWHNDSIEALNLFLKRDMSTTFQIPVPVYLLIPEQENLFNIKFEVWQSYSKYTHSLHNLLHDLFSFVINHMCQFWKTNYGLIVFRELILDQKQTALNVSKFDFKCRMYRLVLNAFIQTERFQMRLQEKKEEKSRMVLSTTHTVDSSLDTTQEVENTMSPINSTLTEEDPIDLETNLEKLSKTEETVAPQTTITQAKMEIDTIELVERERKEFLERQQKYNEEQKLKQIEEKKERERRHAQKERARSEIEPLHLKIQNEKQRAKNEKEAKLLEEKKRKEDEEKQKKFQKEQRKQQKKREDEAKSEEKHTKNFSHSKKIDSGHLSSLQSKKRPTALTLSHFLPGPLSSQVASSSKTPSTASEALLSGLDFPPLPTNASLEQCLEVVSNAFRTETEETQSIMRSLLPLFLDYLCKNPEDMAWLLDHQNEKLSIILQQFVFSHGMPWFGVDFQNEEKQKYKDFMSSKLPSQVIDEVEDDQDAKCRHCTQVFDSKKRFPMVSYSATSECVLCGECWATFQNTQFDTKCDICQQEYAKHSWELRNGWISQRFILQDNK